MEGHLQVTSCRPDPISEKSFTSTPFLPDHSCQGFFRSLFTAGFSESRAARRGGADEISVTFDDCNITRPGVGFAFNPFKQHGSNICVISSFRVRLNLNLAPSTYAAIPEYVYPGFMEVALLFSFLQTSSQQPNSH